ncbi:hypothetical protein Tco_0742938 [Tanacetum coccineum]
MVVTQPKTITEASLRRYLKLVDAGGISSLPNTEIFEQLALMGSKKTAWEQFSSNIAAAIICLATNGSFNFSKMIFKGMVKNLDNRSKFLMHPRFIQILLNKHQRLLLPHKRTYVAPTLTQKLFSKTWSRGSLRVILGNTFHIFKMRCQRPIQQVKDQLVQVESHHITYTTPIHLNTTTFITSSDTYTPHDHHLPRRLEQDLKQTKKEYGNAYTKIIIGGEEVGTKDNVKANLKRRAKMIQEDAEIQGRTSADTEILLDQEEPTELVEDLGSGEKGKKEFSTANISVSTATVTHEVSITAENLVYIRRSAEKRKDKGKAFMKEDESIQKKAKEQLEQERLGHEEAIRLQEQINEEER